MPPPGRGRGRGRGGPHRPGPHRPHHPHPHPAPHRPHPVGRAVVGAVGAVVGAAAVGAAAVGAAVHHKPKPGPAPKTFERLYHWGNHATVVVTHSLGKNLRVRPGDHTQLDYEGGTGELARWKVHVHENGASIQLESLKTGKFLRMKPNGDDFDVNGIPKGPNTHFIVERKSTGVAFLKTKKTFHNNKHAYIAVMHGKLAQKRLTFYVEGLPREWEKAYKFGHKRVVVIQHPGFNNLRVHNGNLEGNGGTGKFARWEADPDHQNHTVRFKNMHSGHYLRIHGPLGGKLDADGKGGKFCIFKVHHIGDHEEKNHVKLESLSHPGKFVAVGNDGPRVGQGGPFCALTLYKE